MIALLNSIFERRVRTENGYDLYLEIPEKEYLQIYEDVNDEAAHNIMSLFLQYHRDDGRPKDIKIKHDSKNHSVNIRAFLDYEDNTHTDETMTPHRYLSVISKKEL